MPFQRFSSGSVSLTEPHRHRMLSRVAKLEMEADADASRVPSTMHNNAKSMG